MSTLHVSRLFAEQDVESSRSPIVPRHGQALLDEMSQPPFSLTFMSEGIDMDSPGSPDSDLATGFRSRCSSCRSLAFITHAGVCAYPINQTLLLNSGIYVVSLIRADDSKTCASCRKDSNSSSLSSSFLDIGFSPSKKASLACGSPQQRDCPATALGDLGTPVARSGSPQDFDMERSPKASGVLDAADQSCLSTLSDDGQKAVANKSDSELSSRGLSYNSTINRTMVLPDQSAFDTSRRSNERYSTSSSPVCPPTPQRTPTWAHEPDKVQGLPPIGLHRQNSLVASKLLLSQSDVLEDTEFYFQREFEDKGLIGSGQFSEVFMVTERGGLLRSFAVKKSKRQFKSKKDRDLLMNEVQTMKRLGSCDYIIQFFNAWQENCFFFVQIDLAERGTLSDLLCDLSKRGDRVSDLTVWKVAHNVASGLHHIHSCGLVHLDVKPANILIDSSGVLKIGDFGMAKYRGLAVDDNEGDQRYMAPELLIPRRVLEPSADIFSWSLTLYETCLVPGFAALPYDGDAWHNLRNGNAPPLTNRDPALSDIIMRAMSEIPAERPTSAEILQLPVFEAVMSQLDATLLYAKSRIPICPLNRSSSFRPLPGLGFSSVDDLRIKTPTGEGSMWNCVESSTDSSVNSSAEYENLWVGDQEKYMAAAVAKTAAMYDSTIVKQTILVKQNVNQDSDQNLLSPGMVVHDFSADMDRDLDNIYLRL